MDCTVYKARLRRGKIFALWVMALTMMGGSGCAVNRPTKQPFATGGLTQMTRNNFVVTNPGVVGTSYGVSLLGTIPIFSPTGTAAMMDIHRQVDMANKSMSLVNVVQDDTSIYLIILSITKITVSADVVEFLPDNVGAVGTSGLRATKQTTP